MKKAAPQMSCKARVGRGPLRRGTATLEREELRFNTGRTGFEGQDFAIHIRHEDVVRVEVDAPAGVLTVHSREQGTLELHLGRTAAAWKELLDARPDLLRDLGVGKTTRVAVVGVLDERLEQALMGRTLAEGAVDVLFAGAEHRADLARLGGLAARVRRGGVMWVVFPERSRTISGEEIAAAARGAGLADGEDVELSPGRRALRLTRS